MSEFSKDHPQPASHGAPRAARELFCIHSYAGELGPPCGWRGLADELARDRLTGERRCPRCGRTTLMEIPKAE